MINEHTDPRWLRRFTRWVLRLGRPKAIIYLTVIVYIAATVIAQGLITVTGIGNRVMGVISVSVSALTLTPLLSWVILGLVYRLEAARAELTVLSTQDPLTGVYNRRHFIEIAEREWARTRRYETESALLLIDADHFKRINDVHGHLCGDRLLRELTRITGESLRGSDVLARFGGEELVVLLPHTDPLGALDVAERIRAHVSTMRMDWNGQTVSATVSIGVAAIGPEHPSLDSVIQDADNALYAAKAAGRNCVRAAPIQPRRNGETTPVISK